MPKTQRGLALVTAILVVALATTIAAFVAFGQQLWLRQMENVSDRSRTDLLVRGALQFALVALVEDARQGNVDHLGESWAIGLPPLPAEGGSIQMKAEDAQGRFNLNNVWRNNAPSTRDLAIFRELLKQLGLSPDLAESLLDWRDPDLRTQPGGAEDTEYLTLDPPYRAANQRLVSVDELRLVRGFTPVVVEALRPYVTTLPADTDINVNTAPPLVIAALVPGLSVSQAEQALSGRERNPFRDPGEFMQRLPGARASSTAGLSVKSDYFLVMLDTAMGRHRRRTEALVARSANGQSAEVLWRRPQPILLVSDEKES